MNGDAARSPGAASLKRRAGDAILARRDELLALSHRIHAAPEPAFEERRAATWVAEAVRAAGYRVEHPAGRLETAVRGRLVGGGAAAGPRIAILAEYDALPGLGHGCGHNLMAAAGVGAAIGLAAVAPELAGDIVFLGTPAEEFGSGKQVMLDDGLLDGLDATLVFHPSDRTTVECRFLACEDIDVVFTGLEAHAAAAPWDGRNALDAMVMLLNAIGLWRQQLPPDARVHGIIREGGTAANIIPARTVGRFMIRSTDETSFGAMEARFRDLVSSAAAATGCQGEVSFSGQSSTMKHNATIGAVFAANLAARGLADEPADAIFGSSDMGNVSQVVPSIHPALAICREGIPKHSTDFRDAAITPQADAALLLAATLLAETAIDLFLDPDLVEAAWREFRAE